MNKYIKNFIKSKTSKRVVSGLTALVMLSGITPLNEISDELSKFSISPIHVFADDTPEFTQDEDHVVSIFIDELVRYSEDCEKYREYHKNDNLRITVNAQTEVLANGFKGLGNDSFPFEGTVSVEANSSLVLFLDAPLFNAVYDDVSINATSENVLIKRGYDSGRDENYKKTPLLAKKVYHGTGTTATWKVTLSGTSTESFGGLIGTMVKDSNHGIANLSVELAMQESETPVPIKGTGNVGFICGTMMEDTTLSCTLNASSGTLRKIGGIETNSGHVGGLVGELQNGATLNYTGSVPQTDGADIKTDANGYAGGLVGKNLDGTINLYSAANTPYSSSNKYTIDQHMTGSSGAGGLYGYFEPQSAATASINPSVYAINCQVNGSGNTGGLIGDLVSDCAVTLSGTGTITSSHASGTASTYGGLIGQYSTSNDSSISVTSMEVGTSCAGTATNYGGAIGCIPDTTNVHATFTSFTATSANVGTLTYGGLVASAKKAYIDVNGTSKITASGFKGGGLIGDLGDGVLVIDGSVDLSAAPPTADEQSVGKVVGKRDNALVIKKETATLDTPSTAVDNIGSWGDVIAFDDLFTISGTSIVIKAPSDSTDHYKKITSEADYAKTALCFQIDASQNPYVSFADITYTYEDTENDKIAEQDISIVLPSGTTVLNLSGKGFGGLTRDNDIGTSGDKCTYSGTFDGKNNTLNLSIGPVYRHSYIGLFAIADNATIQNVTFGSTGTINVNALADMYVGATAAKSTGAFTVKNVTVGTAFTHAGSSELVLGGIVGESDGAGTLTIGDSTGSAGNVTVNANITSSDSGSTGDVYLGGIIGRISHSDNEAVTWNFNKVNVTGTIKNSAAHTYNRVGGLVAFISNTTSGDASSADVRSLNLNTVNIKGLSIEVNASENGAVGGLLGYAWRNVNVDFNEVTADVNGSTPCSIKNTGSATGVDFAGLVYNGTGYWKADSANDIKIDSFALSSDNATSFGMIVNRGWYADTDKTMSDSSASAIYLELGNTGAYSLTTGATFKQKTNTSTNMTIPTFDELVAYTAYYTGSGASKVGYKDNEDDLYIIKNGQGIVSIKTSITNGLTMDGTTASGSYTPKTSFGQQMNPYSRYYYNLSDFRTSPANDEQKLMSWGARWYAHSSIKKLFTDNSWGSTVPTPTTAPTQAELDAGKAATDRDYDMMGYSWYPLNIDSASVSITGTFKLYNKEFEVSESAAHNANAKHSIRSSLYNSGTSQHFLMQSALFYDVNHNLTVNNVTLQGSIPQINTIRTIVVNETSTSVGDKYAGALILGKVKGTGVTDSTKSVVKLNTVTLDGIYVHNFSIFNQDGTTYANDYAPLLINKSGSYATLTVSGISNNEYPSSFSNDRCATYTDSSSNTVYCPKIATSLIGNVGNTDDSNVNIEFSNITLDGRSNNLDLTALDTAYNSKISLFTKATLLNRLSFNSGKGSYSYQWSDDCTSNQHHVTYGKEVGYTVADSPVLNQYPNMERCYADHNTVELGFIYTDPQTNAGTGTYADTFISSYLPYVAVKYTPENRYYQLEVNHATSKFGGCGTYNDPYTITSGDDFVTISKILAGNCTGAEIYLPMKSATAADLSLTWHGASGCGKYYFISNGSQGEGFYLNNNESSDYQKTDNVRTYVAGAYFKLAPKNDETTGAASNTITINSIEFTGLGNTDNALAQFRGVIVGNKNQTVINETDYPLIAISNGSVIKDFDIVVGSSTVTNDITLSQDSAKSFSATGEDRGDSYGAVMGIVLGGDNIIDNVSVQFQNTTITLSGNAAQLIPVGGYVGVVEKGGVIFRGMEGKTDGISGLPATGTVVQYNNGTAITETMLIKKLKTGSTTEYEDNMRWLYVNPIIGRVINGYAVTEASAYRPYEDGTRVYHGGARTLDNGEEDTAGLMTKYWDETNQTEVDTAPSTLSHVTMQNGNKHYSIADIKSAWGAGANNKRSLTYSAMDGNTSVTKYYLTDGEKLDFGPTSDTNSTKVKTKPLVPNGQAFFLMSVMVNSGIAKNALGYNQVYQVSRWAQYDDVGSNASNADGSDWKTYAQKDRVDSTNGTESKRTAKQSSGYLANFYTMSAALAKEMANQNTTLTLSTNKGSYYLPDGFKGIGNLINSSDDNYRMKIVTFNGNSASISQNTSFYYYFKKNGNKSDIIDSNYTPAHHVANNETDGKIGLGLINYQSTTLTASYLSLRGNVVADAIDISSPTGEHIPYYGSNNDWAKADKGEGIDRPHMLSSGAFIGRTASILNLTDILLDNVNVRGLKSAGGLLGYSTDQKITITVNKDCNNVKVHSAGNAGGLIGRKAVGAAAIDFTNHHLNITEVVCESTGYTAGTTAEEYDANYSVGGLIGGARSDFRTNTNSDKIYMFRNIHIGDKDTSTPVTIKCENANFFTGGLIGTCTRASLEIENCHIYNLNLTSKYYAGGLVGQIATVPNDRGGENGSDNRDYKIETKITNCSIEKNASSSYGQISSTGNASGGFIGAGKNDLSRNVILTNCYIKGITISSALYSGGVAGVWGYIANGAGKAYTNCLSLNNFSISDCTLKGDDSIGGLVGVLNNSHQAVRGKTYNNANYTLSLKGYNIIAKNLKFEAVTSAKKLFSSGSNPYNAETNTDGVFAGYICGYNEKLIQIAGFSRQDDQQISTMISDTVGYGEYGSDGYVIFADYNGLTSNSTASSVNLSTGYEGANPYVTVNPKMLINSSSSSNPLFFTSDGVSALNYVDSAFKAITDARKEGTDNKRYTFYKNGSNTDISDEDIEKISANYKTSDEAYGNYSGVRGFPLLVIDDTDADKTTALINNYVNVLANTDYNYADTTKSDIYSVNFKRYYFNGTDFVEDRTAVASMSTTGSKFKMDPDHVDTSSTPKFTLMDVQFKDPSSPSNVAYHLYIPLYVKQLLRFEFNATVASDTNYYPSAYPAGRTWEFENYGNPVTIMLEYDYVRTPSQWAEAINSGDSVLDNYYKSLMLSNLINASAYPSDYNTSALPPDSKLVLVDASNNDKAYYLDSVPATGEINFYDFTSDGAHYTPAPFQNLMNIRVEQCDTGTLVATANNTTTDAIVEYKGIYYRRAVEGDTGLCRAFAEVAVQANTNGTLVEAAAAEKGQATVCYNSNYYRPATDEELADAETVKYKMLDDVETERYYLSIFTKESNSTSIYHATIQTAEAFAEKSGTMVNDVPVWTVKKWRPNNIYGSNTSIHLFYGNLFENYVDMNVSSLNGSTLMNDENQYLKVELIANVKLSKNAIGKNLASNLSNRTKGQAGVYQTFLLRYDMKDETTNNFGIVKEAGVMVVDTGGDNGYYMQSGSITTGEEGHEVIDKTLFTSTSKVSAPTYITNSSSYIEFRNNVNIVNMLGSSTNDYAVAFKVKADLLYASNALSYQFPPGNGDGTTGSLVLGYSNISGSSENAAYSTFTKKVEDRNGYRYYTKNETKAKLGYEVIETPDPDALLDPDSPNPFIGPYGGDYSYLGINASEINGDQNKHYVDSYATYDLSSIYPDGRNQATDYIRLTLSLSKKGSYLSPTVDSEHAGGTALKISDFIEDITLSGVPYEGSEVLYSNEADSSVNGRTITDGENSVNLVTSQLTEKDSEATTGTMLVLIIRKDQLKRNTEGTEYYFPISYKVKTGAAANFDNSHSNMTYSNYMVSLTAAECNASGEAFNSTFATDYLIYTNAMLDPTVK
ncbi:hypothetical protein [Ruminococcus flavefaciens]|uniref:hypothetical protein n=1 Tax=Ruminococcus flavefaciens TaxID=1265 RepID=UPI0026F35354|nr:hypothetical protein [Ruminococcus flavefaciens]